MASCRQIERLIQPCIDGELGQSEQLILDLHISECRSCAALLDSSKTTAATLYEALREVRLLEDLTPKVMAHLPDMESLVAPAIFMNWQAEQRRRHAAQLRTSAFAMVAVVLAVLGFAIFLAWPPLESSGRTVGMVTFQKGQVQRTTDDQQSPRRASVQGLVKENERYVTSMDSTLMLALTGGTELKINEDSRVKVEGDRRIAIEAGRVWLHVSKDDAGFHISTPTGAIRVFGTTFEVSVDPDRTLVTVKEGEVQVENDMAFSVLKPGQQASLVLGQRPTPREADPGTVMRWADDISADPEAQEVFLTTVKRLGDRVMRAEQMWVVEAGGHEVRSIDIAWEQGSDARERCGYTVYVSDASGNPLLIHRIPASIFQAGQPSEYSLTLEETQVISGVNLLHIKIVPDRRAGTVETMFAQIEMSS